MRDKILEYLNTPPKHVFFFKSIIMWTKETWEVGNFEIFYKGELFLESCHRKGLITTFVNHKDIMSDKILQRDFSKHFPTHETTTISGGKETKTMHARAINSPFVIKKLKENLNEDIDSV